MYAINAQIEGIAPILFNGWTEEALYALDTGKTGGKMTVTQREDEAWQKLYKDEAGIYFPKWAVKRCLMDACSMGAFKEGKKSLAPYITATVHLDGDPHFAAGEEPVIHKVWGRRPPRTGAACLVRRPALPTGWKLPVRLVVLDDRRDAGRLKEVMETAGLLVGLGSWRPEYGRFIVTEWQVEKMK